MQIHNSFYTCIINYTSHIQVGRSFFLIFSLHSQYSLLKCMACQYTTIIRRLVVLLQYALHKKIIDAYLRMQINRLILNLNN